MGGGGGGTGGKKAKRKPEERADLSDSEQLTEMVDVVVRLAINRDESWWERAVGVGDRRRRKTHS